MSSSSRSSESSRSCERRPDWLTPRMSPSWRCSTSSRANSNPSVVAATASSRSRDGDPVGASVTSRHRPGSRAAADPPPQLVQLRDAEPLGVQHHHHRRVGHIDTDLDHRRRDDDIDLAAAEGQHHRVLDVGGQPTVQGRHPKTGERSGREFGQHVLDGQRRPPIEVVAELVVGIGWGRRPRRCRRTAQLSPPPIRGHTTNA